MDYSELVKSLRICVKSTDCVGCIKNADGAEFGCKPLGDSELVLDAADAIEELSLTLESYKRSMEEWAEESYMAYRKYAKAIFDFPKEER